MGKSPSRSSGIWGLSGRGWFCFLSFGEGRSVWVCMSGEKGATQGCTVLKCAKNSKKSPWVCMMAMGMMDKRLCGWGCCGGGGLCGGPKCFF